MNRLFALGGRSILRPMRSFGLVSLLAVLILPVVGCGKQERQSFNGIYCSHEDEDPMYVCSKTQDLVCIATDRIILPTGMLGPERYLCRLSCKPGESCPEGICCPGKIYGNDRGSSHACVPISFCESPPDAATRDTRPATDGGAEGGGDTARDGGPGDGAGDSPVDVPVDAPDDYTAG
jgi:hypothetical protein